MAAQPPGPGLPRQAPSVKISTAVDSGIEAIAAEIGDAAVEPQLAQIFEWILWPNQRPRRLVEPIEQSRQQKPERAAARQQWQSGELGCGEGSPPPVAVEQQPSLCHIEAAIGFEAPGIEANR